MANSNDLPDLYERPGAVEIDLVALRKAVRREIKIDGCTQQDLADYMGVTLKHANQMLTGKATGNIMLLDKMCEAVGLDLYGRKRDA